MTENRYKLPAPICKHERKGIVEAGNSDNKGPYASTDVCNRIKCIGDAIEWAQAVTHLKARYIADRE